MLEYRVSAPEISRFVVSFCMLHPSTQDLKPTRRGRHAKTSSAGSERLPNPSFRPVSNLRSLGLIDRLIFEFSLISMEYGLRVYDCQPCSWSAEPETLMSLCPRSRLGILSSETFSAVPSPASPLNLQPQDLALTHGFLSFLPIFTVVSIYTANFH